MTATRSPARHSGRAGYCCATTTDGVTTLTLNRPAQFNALTQALLGELETALAAIALDPVVRVVVLAGAGKAFCAGHDLREIHESADPRDRERRLRAAPGE